jgi:hypothetical protein
MDVNFVSQQLLFNTVPLEVHDADDQTISTGTSFIVSFQQDEGAEELFLVTNKHVLEGGFFAYFYMTEIKDGKPVIGKRFVIKTDFIQSQFHGHPDPAIDIAVYPLSWQLALIGKSGVKGYFMKVSTEVLASAEEIEAMDTVKEIIFVGYPNGLYDTRNYTPIIRSGTTATPVQLDFCGRPAFLIDASVFPGSSGSPVFSFERSFDGDIVDVRLLGIVAEVFTQEDQGSFRVVPAPTQVIPIVEYRHMIDLGIVLKAHLISETMSDWWEKHKQA